MKKETKQFIIRKLVEKKGWDKFEEDLLLYGLIVTDEEQNRVDPATLPTNKR